MPSTTEEIEFWTPIIQILTSIKIQNNPGILIIGYTDPQNNTQISILQDDNNVQGTEELKDKLTEKLSDRSKFTNTTIVFGDIEDMRYIVSTQDLSSYDNKWPIALHHSCNGVVCI